MSRPCTSRLCCIGFILIVLTLCIVSITCKKIPYYILKQTDEIKSANLMSELSKPLKPLDQGTSLKVSVGKQVALILARARDKRKKRLILGEFSVKDLLRLNKIGIEDCHVDKLAERRQFCEEKFNGKHENLYKYCTKTNSNLSDWCNTKIEDFIKIALNKLSKLKQAKKLRNEIKKVAKSETKKIMSVADTGHVTPEEVFNSILAKQGDSFKARATSVCKKLDGALKANFEIELNDKPVDYKMEKWDDFLRYCQYIIRLSPPVKDEVPDESDDEKDEEEDDFDEDDLDELDEDDGPYRGVQIRI